MKFWSATMTCNQVMRLAILMMMNDDYNDDNKWHRTTSRNTNIHLFVDPAKGVKKSEAPHINTDSSPLYVLMFFT